MKFFLAYSVTSESLYKKTSGDQEKESIINVRVDYKDQDHCLSSRNKPRDAKR